jgi:hypothetical protein
MDVGMNVVEQQIADALPDVFGESHDSAAPDAKSGNTIIEGQRNAMLTALAGAMRRKGFSVEAIAAALQIENERRCQPVLPQDEVDKIARSIGRYTATATPQTTTLVGLTLGQLSTHTFPERKPIFVRGDTAVFRAGHIGQAYAERGFGKSWFVGSLALAAAAGSEALGFRAPDPCRVLLVDGEMSAQELQERFALLSERLCIPTTAGLTIVAADWQEQFLPRLDTDGGQAALEPFVEAADLVILDNRSCLFDPEGEKDPSAWQPAQDWLLSLRHRGKAVLLTHHSNRMGGARGHSKSEDPMNLLIKLSRPEDYSQEQGARFIVTFEKSRGAHGSSVAPFSAQLTPTGWRTEAVEAQRQTAANKILEYLRLADEAGDRPKSANVAIAKARVNRNEGLRVWAELRARGQIHQLEEGGFRAR